MDPIWSNEIATSHGSLTLKGTVLEGKSDPGYFREIDRLVKYYEPFGQESYGTDI